MHKKNSYHIDPVTKKSLSKEHRCLECGAVISRQATLCSACYNKSNRKVERPTAEELFQFLISIKGNFSAASRHYGVSDNAIRKWCKAYNIPSKSADYK